MTAPHALRASVIAVVALGGAVGALLRSALSTAFPDASGGFPWTVFAVNVVGCALLASLPAVGAVRRHPLLPPLLGTGFCGALTTYSSFIVQSTERGARLGSVNVVVTLVPALLLGAAGFSLGA